MTEPRRLLAEAGSELEHELLRSAEGDVPGAHARRRTLIALGIGTTIVGATVTTASSTAAASTGFGGILKWVGIGMVGGGLAVGGAQQAVHLGELPRATVAEKGHEATIERVVKHRGPSHAAPVRAEEPRAPSEAEPEVDAAASAALPPKAPAATKAGPSLADEVAQLDRAREALNKGESSRALAALEQHDHQFGTALLGPEAMVLRLEALAQRGDKAGAAALASEFLATYPKSPHANRVRSLVAQSGEPLPKP